MAEDRMAVLDTVRKAIAEGDVDFLREGVRVLAQAVMEAEVTELTGVPKGERDPERRLTNRNGYRERRWDTRVGTVNLSIPRVRDGSYFPSLLEPRRRVERALLAVVSEAYVAGVSTCRVEDLVEALGISSMSKSEVSRICAALDAEVAVFRSRSLTGEAYPYLWLDATYLKVREGGRVVSMAALVAVGVALTGERRVLGLELAAGNDEGSAWPTFIRGLVERGLRGVRLVISDDHRGLVKAVREQLLGASWQRCRVHATRNAQDLVPRSARSMVASAIRMIFEQPDEAAAREQASRVIEGLRPRFPAVADLLAEAEADLLVHFTFPESHRRQIRSTDESVKSRAYSDRGTRATRRGEEQGPGMSALPRSRSHRSRESLPSCGARVSLLGGSDPPGRDEAPVLLLGSRGHGALLSPDGRGACRPASAAAAV